MTYDGRVEAQMNVPQNTAVFAVTDQINNTVVLPAGPYFLSSVGNTPGLLPQLAASLNASAPPFAYPRSAAAMSAAVNYGIWSAGWLCDEASGSLGAVFGSPSMVPSGSPTYGTAGPRGGTDKAIGFSGTSDLFSGGNVFNVSATDDLVVAWVGYQSADPSAYHGLVSKYPASTFNGWYLEVYPGGGVWFYGSNAGGTASFSAAAAILPLNAWYVGIAALDRSTGKANVGTRVLSTGVTQTSGLVAAAADAYNNAGANFTFGGISGVTGPDLATNIAAVYIGQGTSVALGLPANLSTALANFAGAVNAAWTVTLSTGPTGTGQVSINCTGGATPPAYSLAWTSTTLRDLLGFTADISGATSVQTGTKQARGLWIPDCPVQTPNGHGRRVPKVSDLRTTTSPTGTVLGLIGNVFFRHQGVGWSHVPQAKTWEQAVAIPNASFETFFNETQLGQSSSWFLPSSPIQLYGHDGVLFGQDANGVTGLVNGWQMTGITSIEPKVSDPSGWPGYWAIEFPELVSSG